MAGLGEELHAMKECVNFNGQVISALFFADDLVLILRTKVTGMEHMLKEVSRFSKRVYMKLSIVKTVILSSEQEGQVWKVEPETPYLEATLVGKFQNKGLQLNRSVLIPFFLYCSFLFRFVLFHYVLSRTTVFPFCSILGVII